MQRIRQSLIFLGAFSNFHDSEGRSHTRSPKELPWKVRLKCLQLFCSRFWLSRTWAKSMKVPGLVRHR